MKFTIYARWSNAVRFECELDDSFKERGVRDQRGEAVRQAYLSGSNLRGSNLRDSNLRGSNLRGSDLSGSDLSGSDLSGSDLRGSDLSGSDLSGSDLSGSDLRGSDLSEEQRKSANFDPITPEEIARLDEVRAIVLAKPQRLDMSTWHSSKWTPEHTPEEEHSCGSAHCIAGWLQALSPDKSLRELEPSVAGRKLAPASAYMFYKSDAVALEWLKTRAYAEKAAT